MTEKQWENKTKQQQESQRGMRKGFRQKKNAPPPKPLREDVVQIAMLSPLTFRSYHAAWVGFDDMEIKLLPRGVPTDKLAALESVTPRIVPAPPSSIVVPDLTAPIVGWRVWKAVEDKYLSAIGVNHAWKPRKACVAVCMHQNSYLWGPTSTHLAPEELCNCGVWAFKSLALLQQAVERYENLLVIGQVSLWGKVIECENGYRAEYAYPKELWLLDSKLERLGWEYGVPIRTMTAPI